MIDTVLLLVVIGTVAIAAGVDIAAIVGWIKASIRASIPCASRKENLRMPQDDLAERKF